MEKIEFFFECQTHTFPNAGRMKKRLYHEKEVNNQSAYWGNKEAVMAGKEVVVYERFKLHKDHEKVDNLRQMVMNSMPK